MNATLRSGTPEEAGMLTDRIKRIADMSQDWVTRGLFPALVVLLARRGIIVLYKAFGRLTPEPDSPPLKLESIFPLSSLTKPLTATLTMIMLEDGLLSLNHPVVEYIPEFVGEGKDKVMIHHLLTHTSGITGAEVYKYAEKKKGSVEIPPPDKTQHPELNEYLFLRYGAPLSRPPGEAMTYSDINYGFLGEIVRRVSGKSLDDFARERLFGPLGMKDSYYETPDSVRHRIADRPADVPFADEIEFDVRLPLGSDGVISTAMDMAIFGQMFLNGGTYGDARILSPASVYEMTRDQIPGIGWRYGDESGPEANWGFGWNIRGRKKYKNAPSLCPPETFSHGGARAVQLTVDPVYEIVSCFFSVSLSISTFDHQLCLFRDMSTAAIADL